MKRPELLKLGAAVSALLIAVSAACLFGYRHTAELLDSQRAAERWQGENTVGYAQVSCYAASDGKLTEEQIYGFRGEISRKLKDASFDTENSRGLFNDAWSTSGTVKVSSERKSGEVQAIAVGGSFFDFHPIHLVSGNYIRPDDLMKDRVLLDRDTAWLLFGGTELTGMSFRINGEPFVVAGVIEREDDVFSERAYNAGMGIYMSWEAFSGLNEKTGISCYELVMPEPVKHFAYNFVKEKFPIGAGEIVDNTYRFDTDNIFRLIKNRASRSMMTGSAVYPYWENAARGAEDRCVRLLMYAMAAAVLPTALLLAVSVRLITDGRKRLENELIPKAKETVGEAVRVRARRRWEKKHPDMK